MQRRATLLDSIHESMRRIGVRALCRRSHISVVFRCRAARSPPAFPCLNSAHPRSWFPSPLSASQSHVPPIQCIVGRILEHRAARSALPIARCETGQPATKTATAGSQTQCRAVPSSDAPVPSCSRVNFRLPVSRRPEQRMRSVSRVVLVGSSHAAHWRLRTSDQSSSVRDHRLVSVPSHRARRLVVQSPSAHVADAGDDR